MSTDDVHEETVNGSKRTTTRSDVDVEDTPPEADEPAEGTDEGLLSWEDVTYARDESGNLSPVELVVEELGGMAKALPMTDSQRKVYVEDLMDDESDKDAITDGELADLFDRNLLAPDLTESPHCPNDRVTEQFVADNMSQYMQDGCYIAVLLASDEHDVVRLMRNDLRPGEIDMAVAMQRDADEQGNRPGRNRG